MDVGFFGQIAIFIGTSIMLFQNIVFLLRAAFYFLIFISYWSYETVRHANFAVTLDNANSGEKVLTPIVSPSG